METKTVSTRKIVSRLPFVLLLPLGIFLPVICKGHTEQMERYATEYYPKIKDLISSLTSWIPISLAEAILYALCIGIPLLIISRLIFVFLRKIDWKYFINLILTLVIITGVVWNLFYVTWGFNYFRDSLRNRIGLEHEHAEVTELQDLTIRLADKASELREILPENEEGVFAVEGGGRTLFPDIIRAYDGFFEDYPELKGKVTVAKPVSWSEGLSWAGICGVYVGLTAEPNVNVVQTDLLMLESAAHEMAHQLGNGPENEAEFIGTLVCLYSDRPEIVYSGVISALIRCQNSLLAADRELYDVAREHFSEKVERDLAAHNAYWKSYEGPVVEYADKTNDNYLKHNSVESGVKSYGESVELLLDADRAKNILECIKKF